MMTDQLSSASPEFSGDEVSHDAMQLITVSLFNGFCRTVSALSANGLLEADQIENIHDAMTFPLDDPDHGDEPIVIFARTQIEKVLSKALRDVRER